jgi:nitroreductase
MTHTTDEALKLALEALEEIALAGMSGTGQESDEAMTAWHARQAWKFIGVAARALEPIKQARALDKMAENARELGLDYEPAQGETT